MPSAIRNLKKLDFATSTKILLESLTDKPNLKPGYIKASPTIPNRATYLIDEQNKEIIFATPLNTVNVSDYLSALQEKLGEAGDLDNYHLILPVIGNGITEQHIVTLYKPKRKSNKPNKAFVIDSKTSDPDSFFKFSQQTFSQKFSGACKGIFRALIPNYQKTVSPKNVYFESVDYLSTGYQSYVDGVSCGYHTLSTILELVLIIESKKEVLSPKALRSSLNSASNDRLIKENLPRAVNKIIYLEKENTTFLRYRDYIASAWTKTFFNGVNEQTRKKQKFQHIVFGWPLDNRLSYQIIYFLSLTFILHPLQLLLNLVITLPINLIAKTFQYWQHKIFLAENKKSITQYARSALLLLIYPLLGLSKTLSFITTQLFSLLTPFNKILGGRETEHLTEKYEKEDEAFVEISEKKDGENSKKIIMISDLARKNYDDSNSLASSCSTISSFEQEDILDSTEDYSITQNPINDRSKTSLSGSPSLYTHSFFENHTNHSSEESFSDSEQTPLISKTNTPSTYH